MYKFRIMLVYNEVMRQHHIGKGSVFFYDYWKNLFILDNLPKDGEPVSIIKISPLHEGCAYDDPLAYTKSRVRLNRDKHPALELLKWINERPELWDELMIAKDNWRKPCGMIDTRIAQPQQKMPVTNTGVMPFTINGKTKYKNQRSIDGKGCDSPDGWGKPAIGNTTAYDTTFRKKDVNISNYNANTTYIMSDLPLYHKTEVGGFEEGKHELSKRQLNRARKEMREEGKA